MRPTENIKRFVKNSKISSNPEVNKAVLNDLFDRMDKSQNSRLAHLQPNVWRIIMKSRITKLAASMVIIVGLAASIFLIDRAAEPAYALEQTIKASHSVRYLHIKAFTKGKEQPKRFWLEFDKLGNVKNVRMSLPQWASGGDGAKDIIWKQGKAKIWFKKKNSLLTIRDETVSQQMLKLAEQVDPKQAVEWFKEKERLGLINIKIDQPTDKSKPAEITATYLPHSPTPDRRFIIFVNQKSKLVTLMKKYKLNNKNKYELTEWLEMSGYNKPIDPAFFIFEKLPSNITRVDQSTQLVGLAQDSLSDEEIAKEVARQFFTALIEKDYSKAGKLLGGIPGDKLKQMLKEKQIKFIRIVSVGDIAPHPYPKTHGVIVPTVVEFEKNGKIDEAKFDMLGIRKAHNQPNRWVIFGGF